MVLPTLYTLNPTTYTINPEPYVLIPKPRIRDPQDSIFSVKRSFLNSSESTWRGGRDVQGYLHPFCTLHPAPYTLHPAPYTLHPTPCTLHATRYTLHHAPSTPNLEGRRRHRGVPPSTWESLPRACEV